VHHFHHALIRGIYGILLEIVLLHQYQQYDLLYHHYHHHDYQHYNDVQQDRKYTIIDAYQYVQWEQHIQVLMVHVLAQQDR
jgi:serine/threonine-protein kinase RIO1